MATLELSDGDFAMLERLLASLSLNVGNSEFRALAGEMFLIYLAIFFYGTVSGGQAPDGRPVLEALHEDVRHLHRLVVDRA